jgi:serine/threonine protein kinase
MRAVKWFSRRGEADPLDLAVNSYEERLQSESPSLADFWAGLGSRQAPSILAALVKLDLRRRFEAGERPRVLEYLEAFPVLAEEDNRVISLVYEEFCLLQETGEDPDSLAFCEAYSPWRDSLHSQLVYHRELSRAVGAETPAVNFPALGERFDKYRLTSILGEGGVARVYLAIEEALGDRKVAIKVSSSFGQEPSILARLDHQNIVPILTVAESDSGLLGICMPYRAGLTLENLIKRIGRGTPPRAASAISLALRPQNSQSGSPPEEQREGWAGFPINRTFPEGVAWIGLSLANALSYLHKKGVFHRDIKPANILLAYKEGPQLLDFNLAQEPNNPGVAAAAQKGGTLPYMAPEQLKAFIDSSAWESVSESADIYSLGLVLRELLTGRAPELPTSQGSLAREIQSLIDRRRDPAESIGDINPSVPPSFESIIDKCLAFRPEDRYASANDLAQDLRCFLERKPLKFAPNTSKFELVVNWVCRNRRPMLAASLCSVFLALLVWVLPLVLPRSLPGEVDFKRAEGHLESSNPEHVKLALGEFEKLHHERTDTARSSFGLAMTLLKLNRNKPPTQDIQNLIEEASEKADIEKVLQDYLERNPNSAMLHLNMGILLHQKDQLDQARIELETTLKLDPGSVKAHAELADLELKVHHFQAAIDHLESAIEISQRKREPAWMIYGFRSLLLEDLVDLIDEKLEGASGIEARSGASSSYKKLKEQLDELRRDWIKLAGSGEKEEHDYSVKFYEGCLCSIRGVLEFDTTKATRDDDLFRDAAARFEEARALASSTKNAKDRPLLNAQLSKLAKRRSLRAVVAD